MGKYCVLTLIVIISATTTLALDWYALTQANYAAIQNGLSQLNDAASQMNQSITEQQNRVQSAMDELDDYVRQSIYGLLYQYQSLNVNLTTIQNLIQVVYKVGGYKWYVSMLADDYKKTVTNNVMIPAQSTVQNILSAMTNFYANQWQSCSQQYAPQLVQPQLSVGRLKLCITAAIPYFKALADTTLSLFSYGKTGLTTLLGFLDQCSPSSSSCVQKFLNDAPNLMNNLVMSITNLQSLPNMFMQPGVPAVKECTDLIMADIQQTLQSLVNKTTNC
ncbi:AAEL007776-PA [Aedes aegypti]|uniref:AAEL007776-PA n=2 Tax=Aedes aegypti TaxID=7159 RepID=Q170V9_AEDAE|nr:uncharacterized protein LOC5569635 [Aedes aegypti]AAL76030.1 putative 30.5 kDa secreted protein [Aedes aegypti]EAT40497.1 AAEL007776-PA [Aedes aegypti]